jgi:hypothetical protein
MQRRQLPAFLTGAAVGVALRGPQSAQGGEGSIPSRLLAEGEQASWVANPEFPPGDLRRYGADILGNVASDTAVTNALAAAAAGTGISVWHPGGTIRLSRTIMVPNGVTIAGADRTACIFAYTGTGSAFRNENRPTSSGYARVAFRNLQIAARAPVPDGAAIELSAGGYSYYEIDTCQVTGPFQYGVILDGTEITHVHHSIIENSYGAHSINLWIVSGSERRRGQAPGFSNSISISDNQINGATVGIADDGGSNHCIASNNINGNSVPMSMAGTIAFLLQGNEMENRDVYTGDANVRLTDLGIRGDSKGPCQGGEIVGNTFGANMASGNSSSLKFTGAAMHTGISVHGNWFRYNSGQVADIDVTRLGNSHVGPNHATARSGQHYAGVHNDRDGNLLLPPQAGYPGGFSAAATLYGDSRYPSQFASGLIAPWLQLGGAGGPKILIGETPPQGNVAGSVGDIYVCTRGGAGGTLFVKESGANTRTGWVAK